MIASRREEDRRNEVVAIVCPRLYSHLTQHLPIWADSKPPERVPRRIKRQRQLSILSGELTSRSAVEVLEEPGSGVRKPSRCSVLAV